MPIDETSSLNGLVFATETPESLRIIFAEEILECIKKGPLVRVRKVRLRGRSRIPKSVNPVS
jgi:hypothetical protein